ncbi:ABC transporter permease [Bacillus ndiopicus]|uniref:ABC transporter permease n=1 Tax=Bacillus ndiopicus TaxID=1347368 RepID=UPI0005A7CBEB|nr:ABC transporter permease [Bacillus ndiopicus]
MITIFKTKCLLLLRNPINYIISTVVICLFVYLMGHQQKEPIAIASLLNEQETAQALQALQKISYYDYSVHTEQKAQELVEAGEVKAAIFLFDEQFRLVVANDFMDSALLQKELNIVYHDRLQQTALLQAFPAQQAQVKEIFTQAQITPAFHIQYQNSKWEEAPIYNRQLSTLFSFSLFMVIYTTASGVSYILAERNMGVWNRLIVSSISKWQAYTANLAYAFCISYVQLVFIFSIFRYVADVDFYGSFTFTLILIIPYLLCVVALTIFIASITNTISQFNTMIMLIAISFAMLGGAYWLLEAVSSPFIYLLSYISPIRYGLEILKGGSTWNELLQPISILLFMAVVLMGIGINIMEKKADT